MPQALQHRRHRLCKNLGISAIMMRDVNSVGLGSTGTQVNRVAKVARGYSDRFKAKPGPAIEQPLLVEGAKSANTRVTRIIGSLHNDETPISIEVPQCWRHWPL